MSLIVIKNRIKQAICNPSVEFDIGMYSDIAGASRIYTDVISCRQYAVPLICAGFNGVYVFITTKMSSIDRLRAVYDDAARTLGFTSGVFVFMRTEKDDYFISGSEFVKIEHMLDKFENLYNNTRLPYYRGVSSGSDLEMLNTPCEIENTEEYASEAVIARVSRMYLKDLDNRIENIKRARAAQRKVIYKNGIKYVKHPILKFGMIVGENYFPVSDEDPFRFLLLTVFGGIIGLHRFKAGEIAKGIGYIISCGCFGAGYLVDIYSILTGTYHIESSIYHDDEDGYRQEKLRIYVDELSARQKIIGYALLVAGISILYLAAKAVYLPILNKIGFALLNTVQ